MKRAGNFGKGLLLTFAALPLMVIGGVVLITVSLQSAYGGKSDER